MTYSELKFIEAEARLVLGQGSAQAAYEAAVAASVLRITGDANTAWLTANIIGDPVTLEKIITQSLAQKDKIILAQRLHELEQDKNHKEEINKIKDEQIKLMAQLLLMGGQGQATEEQKKQMETVI